MEINRSPLILNSRILKMSNPEAKLPEEEHYVHVGFASSDIPKGETFLWGDSLHITAEEDIKKGFPLFVALKPPAGIYTGRSSRPPPKATPSTDISDYW